MKAFQALQTPIACLNKSCSKHHTIQAMKGYGDSKKVGFGFIKCKCLFTKSVGCSLLREGSYLVAKN